MKATIALTLLSLTSSLSTTKAAPQKRAPALGSWSPVLPLPLSPLSGTALPTGDFLLWSGITPGGWLDQYWSENGNRTNYVIVTLDQLLKQTPTIDLKTTVNSEMFCPGTTNMPNGDILINGGSGPEATIMFDAKKKVFYQGAWMNIPRGYNSNVLTTGDKCFTIGGSFARKHKTFGVGKKDGELFTPGGPNGGSWKISNPGTGNPIGGIENGSKSPDPEGIYRSDNHAWLFPYKATTGDDMVFHAGPVTQMHTINTSKGTMQLVGARSTDAYAMNGNAVAYSPGRILKIGGAPYYGNSNSSVGAPTSAAAYFIKFDGLPSGVWPTTRPAGKMNYPRAFGHAIVLPGGNVFIVGGQSTIQIFLDKTGQLTPEIWNAKTATFTSVAPMKIARNYHSIALLTKDATVILAGGGSRQGKCTTAGVRPCTPDTHFDAEIYTPAYLDPANGPRPVLTTINTGGLKADFGPRFKLGSTLIVSATNCGAGCSYELIRIASATHSTMNDQLRVPLQVSKRSAAGDSMAVFPNDGPFVVSGYYYLFAISPNGTPSVAQIVQVTRT
ncbi:hypothetical protein DFJ77DRAFT_118864 [Powellomyces hirtus]|nr:hypothetical protein DFJ77DRAFT_118864 [Powellomyces hirtus]